ncbi:MAG: hypothetical protein JXA06_07190 [Bacteroidetes bacterium]|nr:hypothetical protein [Bacteroidota bacterium]
MKILSTIVYCISILFLCYFTYSLATIYQENATRSQVSFFIWVVDTIDLFIHETGHLVFKMFGKFMEILGGSLFQVIIPLSALIVFGRANPKTIPFLFYWTGQSTVNVSIYIGDAPYQRLQLISRGLIHDWRWIFNRTGMMEYAGDLASIVNAIGILMCIIGIGIGIYFIVKDCINILSPAANIKN